MRHIASSSNLWVANEDIYMTYVSMKIFILLHKVFKNKKKN